VLWRSIWTMKSDRRRKATTNCGALR
jgi:hypothetical protein